MALTEKEKAYWSDVISRTGAHRETMTKERDEPEEYRAFLSQVDRSEVTVPAESVGVPVKCYVSVAKNKMANCPVHINMHGGGFVGPQNIDDDMYCAHVAAKTRGIVVDVDYATCPDYAFPVAFEQSYAVVRWAFEQCSSWGADPNRVSVGGHSAGGNLAAAIALKATGSKDFSLCLQVLDYAALDLYTPPQEKAGPRKSETPSERERAFSTLYSDGVPRILRSPYASPVFATDDMLRGGPSALIVTAGSCPFCTENELYGQRLAALGTEVTIKRFVNSRHGFTIRLIDEWWQAQELIIRAINEAGLHTTQGGEANAAYSGAKIPGA